MFESHLTSNSRRPILPRDQGGSLTLTEGTGGIMATCPGAGYLELYKEDVTFRLETPEDIDPERMNPHAPFVAAVAERIGCSDAVIARVLLQGQAILQAATFTTEIDKPAVIRVLHGVKEALVACRKAALSVGTSVEAISRDLEERGVARDRFGRSVPSLPQVSDLEHLATQFLISSKRATKGICGLVPLFLEVDRPDSNFDHLGDRLERLLGADAPIVQFIRANASSVRYLIELRNTQEHPQPTKSIRIDNFRIQPDGSVRTPSWYVSGATPAPIASEMKDAISILVEIAEWLVILLVDATLDRRLPYIFVEEDEARIDPKLPIRYRLSLDIGQMRFSTSAPDGGSPGAAAV